LVGNFEVPGGLLCAYTREEHQGLNRDSRASPAVWSVISRRACHDLPRPASPIPGPRVRPPSTWLDRQRGRQSQKLESYLTAGPTAFFRPPTVRAIAAWRSRRMAGSRLRRAGRAVHFINPSPGRRWQPHDRLPVTGLSFNHGGADGRRRPRGPASAGRPLQPDGPAPTVA